MPNKWLIVRYSTFVASLHRATATLWCVGIALRNLVFCRDISGASSSQMWLQLKRAEKRKWQEENCEGPSPVKTRQLSLNSSTTNKGKCFFCNEAGSGLRSVATYKITKRIQRSATLSCYKTRNCWQNSPVEVIWLQ